MNNNQEVKFIRLLSIEDSLDDILIIKKLLSNKIINNFYSISFRIDHVDSLSKGIEISKKDSFDAILLDFELPDGSGMDLVNRIREHRISVPIIILTSYDYANAAMEAIRKGAQDYLSKDEITSKNLIRTICYAIERQKLKNDLAEANERIKTLHGMLPICCKCKQIRDDEGYWHQVETYLKSHSDVTFSHGYCPPCFKKEMEIIEHLNELTEESSLEDCDFHP